MKPRSLRTACSFQRFNAGDFVSNIFFFSTIHNLDKSKSEADFEDFEELSLTPTGDLT
jgi:hypothetical protein